MIYSRIGASLARSSRCRNVVNGAKQKVFIWKTKSLNGQLEFLRGYFAAGANKGSIFGASLSDFKFIAGNPRIYRFFCSKAPKKKNYENFYPNGKKEIPKKSEQKSGSKCSFK